MTTKNNKDDNKNTSGENRKEEEANKEKNIRIRKQLKEEILSTEENYVIYLKLANEILNPVSPGLKINNITKKIRTIPGIDRIEEITKLANSFFFKIAELEEERQKLNKEEIDTEKLAKIFLEYLPLIKKPYTEYIKVKNQIDKQIAELVQSNNNFEKYLELSKAELQNKGLDLSSFLIMPVQRLPRYELLLKGILTLTELTDPGFELLSHALNELEQLITTINEQIKNYSKSKKEEYIKQMEFEIQMLVSPNTENEKTSPDSYPLLMLFKSKMLSGDPRIKPLNEILVQMKKTDPNNTEGIQELNEKFQEILNPIAKIIKGSDRGSIQ